MNQEQQRRLDEIKSGMECQRNFDCLNGRHSACLNRMVIPNRYVECTHSTCDRRVACNYSTIFGNGYFCSCPVRCFLTTELDR